ncbi:permease prefix domain 1-containing protein [Terrisporobacter petrolearius]|uniref:permease prefix domain 1-containing protein n=1 Tax=Terrisporobacter petrolearius TaxID=1460447 RepID=UPI003B007C5C
MTIENNTIENFLHSACRFISTEEKAKDMKDELKDHIYSYIEEYTEDGMSSNAATNMALKQMGDPDILSKIYKDKIYKYNKLFRIFSLITITFIFIFSDFAYISFNSFNNFQIFLCSSFTIFISLQSIFEIVDFIRIIKKDGELSKEDPLFYIQSYKESIWDEKAMRYIQTFLFGFCLILFISFINKFNNIESIEVFSSSLETINSISFILLIVMSVSIFNPKRKSAIVYNEGILMFNSFVPFSSINGYMWSKENINGKACYSLAFSTEKTSFFKKSSLISNERASIKVSSSQITLLNELFKSNNIVEIDG